ncbi:MAG: cation transporting ATPase C-terminal domain-containing protein [Solirubrobacteraceae bacterium]
MARKPRKSDEPILDRRALIWLAFAGAVLGATTLGVIAWANDAHGAAIAHMMGLTTFSIANVYYALCAKDDRRSVFSLDTFDDHRLVLTTGMSIAAIILGAQLGLLNKIIDTVGLNLHEWLICIIAALTIVVASEARKLIIRRREQASEPQPSQAPTQTTA